MVGQKSRLDRAAISAAIESKDITLFLDRGIRPAFFQGDYAVLMDFVYAHFQRYAETPTLSIIKANFPWFKPISEPGSPDYYTDRLRERELFNRMGVALISAREKLESESAVSAFQELSAFVHGVNLEINSAQDLGLADAAKQQLEDYDRRKLGDYEGITTGFRMLDQKILCYENTDLVVIAAPPRSGKTWYLGHGLVNIAQAGHRVLLFSKEMKRKTMARRLIAAKLGLNYRQFRRGQLADVDEARFRRAMKKMSDSGLWNDRLIIIGDDGFDGFLYDDYDYTNTLEFVESKIIQYKPDIVGIDGFYLLSTPEGKRKAGWEQIQILTRKTKRMCNRRHVPVIITTQMTRDSENTRKRNLSNLAFGSSIGQDADVIQFLMRGTGITAKDEAVVEFPKIREEEDCGAMVLKFRPGEEVDFTQVLSAAEVEMMDALDDDD